MTEEQVAGLKSRMDRVTQMLRSRTDADGNAKPGFKSNVAAIRAEIDILREQMEQAGVKHDGE